MHKNLLHMVAVAILMAGCTAEWVIPEDYYVSCDDDTDCPDSADCMLTDDGTARVCVTQGRAECGNGVRDSGEECDDGDENTMEYGSAGRCNTTCDGFAPHCGDGVPDPIEVCDKGDANTDAYDAADSCNLTCSGLAPHCGDGIVNGGETCDSGAANSDAYGGVAVCNTTCSDFAPYCGDGFVDAQEDCDNGEDNTDIYGAPGRCNLTCDGDAPSCGDAALDSGEFCDDGAENTDGYGVEQRCNTSCTGYAPFCGDAQLDANEWCDQGEANSDEYGVAGRCNTACSSASPHCGDGILALDIELCDHGNNNTDGYSATQRCNVQCNGYAPYCGDGVRQDSELCDNPNSASGCTASCGKSSDVECGDGVTHIAFESCDEGNTERESCNYGEEACTICDENCQVEVIDGTYCGDGIVQQEPGGTWEACDGSVSCASLGLGTGIAQCNDSCNAYVLTECSNTDMAYVPSGPFLMGCNVWLDVSCDTDELPPREVMLNAFLIDRYEVTAGQYEQCVDAGACEFNGFSSNWHNTYQNNMDNHPVNQITWQEAVDYCTWKDKRLPTEAEWEKASRGTDGAIYPWGNAPRVDCTYAIIYEDAPIGGGGNGCGTNQTWPVGSTPAGVSPYGLHDTMGNVWEWVSDYYSASFYDTPPESGWVNPTGPDTGDTRVQKGSSFDFSYTMSRSSSRRGISVVNAARSFRVGFRCAQSVQ